jgi:pseudouridine synthase
MKIRLNKYLSQAGVASRREADRMIEAGRVKVNGTAVQTLGFKLDDAIDTVEVDGNTVSSQRTLLYVMLHKPPGYLVTRKDPYKRPTVMDLLPRFPERINPVGRLDFESEGLLLLSNDGDLAMRLLHPRYGVKKMYRVKIKGKPETTAIQRLEKGIVLDRKKTAPARVSEIRRGEKFSWMNVQVQEGRKREVRRMFQAIGHPVVYLKRVRFAGLSLGKLRPGQWRYLTRNEVKNLRRKAGLD